MNRYTPGPWSAIFHKMDRALLRSFYTIRDKRNCFIARVERLDAATWENGQLEANARLIAAAPEVLEALIAAYDHLDYCGFGDKWERKGAREEGLEDTIRAAIQAAQGDCPPNEHATASQSEK